MKFKDQEALQTWLISKAVDPSDAKDAAGPLFIAGFTSAEALDDAPATDLRPTLSIPLSNVISSKCRTTGSGKRSRPKEEWEPSMAKFTPANLPLYELDSKEPEFVAPDGWLSNVKAKVQDEYEIKDVGRRRVKPMCFSRCSRGGKTRALNELERELEKAGIPVIFVTFNDYSTMFPQDPEQDDPLSALLSRIAFIATSESRQDGAYRAFNAKYEVSREKIEEWLADFPCVLIVDEINRAEKLVQSCPEASKFFSFLKETFLNREKRSLVFSSHIVSTRFLSSDYLACTSGRGVLVEQLPLIDDFSKARMLVADLTPSQLLYYNLIPALIHTRGWTKTNTGNLGRQLAENPLNRESVGKLLETFITGESAELDSRFLPFFDVMPSDDDDGDDEIIWIMRHMYSLLKILANHFRSAGDKEMAEQLLELRRFIGGFRDTKTESGDGFEMLFAFTFLLRVLCGSPAKPYFPLDFKGRWSFSCNKFLKTDGHNDLCLDYSQFCKLLLPPKGVTFPHVAFYAPKHARFYNYDAFAFFYEAETKCVAQAGFQCKAGAKTPKDYADTDEFPASFLVRGKPTGTEAEIRGWRFVSKEETEIFFGVSGRMWTPPELTALRARLAQATLYHPPWYQNKQK